MGAAIVVGIGILAIVVGQGDLAIFGGLCLLVGIGMLFTSKVADSVPEDVSSRQIKGIGDIIQLVVLLLIFLVVFVG